MLNSKLIGKPENGVYIITETEKDVSDGKEWAKDVPVYEGGEYDGIYSGGDGSFIVCINNTSEAELRAYAKTLEEKGYRKFAESNMMGNLFYTYENGINLIYAYYINCLKTVKVIAEPYYEYITDTPDTGLVKPAIIASSVCDRNFYVRLPDNTLVVVDGGWRIEDWSLYDHYELFKEMYNEMSEILGGCEKIRVSLWLITHAHTDHARVLENLYKTDLKDKFEIKEILYNFPARNHVDTPMDASEDQKQQMEENIRKWHENAGKDYSYDRIFYNCPFQVYDTQRYDIICREAFKNYGAIQIKAHDGMKFSLAGVEFEILHTPDDDMPTVYTGFNNTSLVIKMTYKGSPMLWLGDMGEVPSDSCVRMYGDLLKCDAMQVSHHGWGAATPEFYDKARPSVLFWNNSEFGFKYADRFQGYGKTKTSTDLYNMDCVRKNFFCNRIRMSYAYLPVTFDTEVIERPLGVILASAVSDRTFMLRLPDKKIVVIDGGWRKEDWGLYDHNTLMKKMYKEMVSLTESEDVTVAAWVVTDLYEHNNRFLENLSSTELANNIKIEKIIYNFVPADRINGGYSELENQNYADILLSEFGKTGAKLIKAEAGDSYNISGIKTEVLYAPEENEKFENIADTSLVVRFTVNGESVIFTGDMTDRISEKLIEKHGENLNCSAVQIANHGWNNCGKPEFYKLCNAKLQLWNNSEYGFQFFRKNEGYRKTAAATEIYKLPNVCINVFCDEVSPQYFSLPLNEKELKYDV